MTKNDIQTLTMEASFKERLRERLLEASTVLSVITGSQEKVLRKTVEEYMKNAIRILGGDARKKIIKPPSDVDKVIDYVRTSNKLSTLQKRVQSLKPVFRTMLLSKYQKACFAIESNDWKQAAKVVDDPSFNALMVLARMNVADYTEGWTAKEKRESKKASLRKLPSDWREMLVNEFRDGQYRIPAIAQFLTGVRPVELEKGLKFIRIGDRLRVRIRGAKVTKEAGQPWRCFDIQDNPIRQMLLSYMDTQPNSKVLIVRVKKGIAVTGYIRQAAKRIWPDHEEDITCYSSRHAMAADCKRATKNGAHPDLVSMVLGHGVDKTASRYGSLSQGGGISMAPTNVRVPRVIKNKQKLKNSRREIPGRKRRTRKHK